MIFAGLQGLDTGTDPQPGAAIVWKNSGDGHVAIVEQVIDANTIVISQSGWDYTAPPIVRTVTRGINGGSWHPDPDYIFQGFIYPPYEKIITAILAFWRNEDD